eukprot:795019-Amorphochlora_amoeboformis.AAC.1
MKQVLSDRRFGRPHVELPKFTGPLCRARGSHDYIGGLGAHGCSSYGSPYAIFVCPGGKKI